MRLNFSKNTPVINIVVGDESSGSLARETKPAELEELNIDEPQLTELKKGK